jgi:hypothetical protein
MSDHFDDATRNLLDQIDARLREAEEVRNYVRETLRAAASMISAVTARITPLTSTNGKA